jgi:hypothetical protein
MLTGSVWLQLPLKAQLWLDATAAYTATVLAASLTTAGRRLQMIGR